MASGDLSVLNLTAVRIAFVITALWWMVFSIPFLRNVKQRYGIEPLFPSCTGTHSADSTEHSAISVPTKKNLSLPSLAYFFYIDGVGTIIKMATDYGSKMGNQLYRSPSGPANASDRSPSPFAILYGWLAKKTSTPVLCSLQG